MEICPECNEKTLKAVEENKLECKFCNVQVVHEGNGYIVESE